MKETLTVHNNINLLFALQRVIQLNDTIRLHIPFCHCKFAVIFHLFCSQKPIMVILRGSGAVDYYSFSIFCYDLQIRVEEVGRTASICLCGEKKESRVFDVLQQFSESYFATDFFT